MFDADVVVVGAGLSGLMAARKIKELNQKASVVVLEGRDRVGGRMVRRAVEAGGKKGWIDLGGQWVGDTQIRIMQLADQLGISTFKQYSQGSTVLWYGGRRYLDAGDDDSDIPAPGARYREAADELSDALEETAEAVVPDPAEPWATKRAAECDTLTLAQWLEANSDDDYARFYVGHDATLNHSGGSPDQVSLLHTLFEIRANPPDENPDEYLLKGAAGQIPPLLYSELGGDETVKLSSTVVAIDQDENSVTVRAKTLADNREYRARAVIVAIPPLLADKIIYSTEIQDLEDRLLERMAFTGQMAMGTIAKVTCVYSTPWWRPLEGGLSGTALVQGRPIAGTDDSGLPGDEGPGILTSFIQGDMLFKWIKYSPEKRKDQVLGELAALFGEKVGNPADYIEALWPREPLTGGAYTTYLPPGGWTSKGMPFRRPIGRMSWAGSETADRWCGYFDGAATAGERAAGEVMKWL